MVMFLLNKCTPADVRPNNSSILLPHANVSSESQILWISVTFQSNFLASCKRFLICLAPPSSHEQSGHICVRQSSTGDFRHQKMDGNASAMNKYTQQLPFIPSLIATDVTARSCFLSHGAMWFHFCLFVPLIPVLEWMRKLDVHA